MSPPATAPSKATLGTPFDEAVEDEVDAAADTRRTGSGRPSSDGEGGREGTGEEGVEGIGDAILLDDLGPVPVDVLRPGAETARPFGCPGLIPGFPMPINVLCLGFSSGSETPLTHSNWTSFSPAISAAPTNSSPAAAAATRCAAHPSELRRAQRRTVQL